MPSYINTILFKNSNTVYQQQIFCGVDESDYNLTYNGTITDSSGSVRDFATGSNFSPYATTIGLYNDEGDLLMVAKFPRPVLISPTTDMTFIIKVDV